MRNSNRMVWLGLLIAVTLPGMAAETADIDLMALTQETQKMSQDPDEMTMVWWIPEEFWEASFAQAPGMSSAEAEEFLKVVRPYTMFVIVDGTMGPFGGLTYKSEEHIRSNAQLVDAKGVSYKPQPKEEIGPDTTNMLQMMKPVFVNMLGQMGQNMHFLLFDGKSGDGKRIADAGAKGEFSVKLGEKQFKWRLPLDSLLPVQVCSGCKQECKGSWRFCPWCGKGLSKEE